MTDLFGFSSDELRDTLDTLAVRFGRRPIVLEKDIWVCWTLKQLFSIPTKPRFAFKGGTSLSKVWRAIDRFSEDVDVTVDYRHFEAQIQDELGQEFDLLAEPPPSRNAIDRFTKLLNERCVPSLVADIQQYLQNQADSEFGAAQIEVLIPSDRCNLEIHYPTVTTDSAPYIREMVLVEFGGRNATEPTESHVIKPDIADYLSQPADLPEALVDVLALERTFWEKLTAVHAAITRTQPMSAQQVSRFSRHLSDLYHLSADQSRRSSLLAAHEVRDSVIVFKSRLFRIGGVNYTDCQKGRGRLVPEAPLLDLLAADYAAMLEAGILMPDAPPFDTVMQGLAALEAEIAGVQ